jgi:hypothetical protein
MASILDSISHSGTLRRQKIGKPNNLKVLGARKSNGLKRIAKNS